MRQCDTVLFDPPLRGPDQGSASLAVLKPILEHAGLPAALVHGTLNFPYTESSEVIRWQYGMFYFVPCLSPDVDAATVVERILDEYLKDYALQQGVRTDIAPPTFEALGLDEAELRRGVAADLPRATQCIDRCTAAILAHEPRVLGISCTFESQLTAGLAVAARVAAARPETVIVLGGSAAYGPAAAALVEAYPQLDAVCHCEGDDVIVPLVRAGLRVADDPSARDAAFADVPGIAWLDSTGQVRHIPAPPLLRDMDRLPMPDYDDFVSQLRRSDWGGLPPRLFFETSRGCWWGQKFLCSFCGFNAEGLTYRRKSPDRAVNELVELHRRYPEALRFYASDNILDMGYLDTVMPGLSTYCEQIDRPLRIWFETKSNLRRSHVETLKAAGVDSLQPGIESFSDNVLRLMEKGATGVTQVQTLKYLAEHEMDASWSIIIWNPNERAEHYAETLRWLPYLRHLQPPVLVEMWLKRFSPYFVRPAHYGIRNVRRRPYYDFVFRAPGLKLDDLAVAFDYDHDMFADDDLLETLRAVCAGIREWADSYRPDLLFFWRHGNEHIVRDERTGVRCQRRQTGCAARISSALVSSRGAAAFRRDQGDIDDEVLDAHLDTLDHRRWLLRSDSGRYLSVVPEKLGMGED